MFVLLNGAGLGAPSSGVPLGRSRTWGDGWYSRPGTTLPCRGSTHSPLHAVARAGTQPGMPPCAHVAS